MSISGVGTQGRTESPRKAWRTPALSVLVFRATALGSGTNNDGSYTASVIPPPLFKGSQNCDGQTPSVGSGTAPFAPFFFGSSLTAHSKKGQAESDQLSVGACVGSFLVGS
jgi:hypothetical protein